MSRERGRAYNETPYRKELTMFCPSLAQQSIFSLFADKGVTLAVASYAYYSVLDFCRQYRPDATNEDMLAMAEDICDSYQTI